MLEQWFRATEVDLSWEEFQRLPRHPAYRYEYRRGRLRLTAHPRYVHCLLDLERFLKSPPVPPARLSCRAIQTGDWPDLEAVFADAFRAEAPLRHVPREQRHCAAREILQRTRSGGDGPLAEPAAFVLQEGESLVGGVLVTLLASADLHTFDAVQWTASPPEDPVEQGWGCPHLTWIFVGPESSRRGGGSLLLAHAAEALHALNYTVLASTILLGNHSSLLWHWRRGFELLPHPSSPGRLR